MRPIDQIEMFVEMRRNAKITGCCASCGNKNLQFRDEVSRKEYTISLLCQVCQDMVFGLEDISEDDFISEAE